MTESLGSFLSPEGPLRVIGAQGLNGRVKLNEVADKVTEQKTYKRLQNGIRQSMSLIRVRKKWIRSIPGRHLRLLRRQEKEH